MDADVPRKHLAELIDLGWTYQGLANHTGYPNSTLNDLAHKSKSIRTELAFDLLSVPLTTQKETT